MESYGHSLVAIQDMKFMQPDQVSIKRKALSYKLNV